MLTHFHYPACVYQQFFKINGEFDRDERGRSSAIESPFFLFYFTASLKRLFAFELGKRRDLPDKLVVLSAVLCFTVVNWTCIVSRMETVMKGIYKGFKYTLSQFFVVKEEEEEENEIEIGCPTDVKHISHIGWDGSSDTAPSWMNEFKTGSDFTATSIGTPGSTLSPWSSTDFSESSRQQSESEILKETASTDVPSAKKKERRKKSKSNSSPRSNTSMPSRPTRPGKSKPKFNEDNAKPTNIEVA